MVNAGCDANPRPLQTASKGKDKGRPTQPPLLNLLMRLRDFTGQILAFMDDFVKAASVRMMVC